VCQELFIYAVSWSQNSWRSEKILRAEPLTALKHTPTFSCHIIHSKSSISYPRYIKQLLTERYYSGSSLMLAAVRGDMEVSKSRKRNLVGETEMLEACWWRNVIVTGQSENRSTLKWLLRKCEMSSSSEADYEVYYHLGYEITHCHT
jgi:hypothetical protein